MTQEITTFNKFQLLGKVLSTSKHKLGEPLLVVVETTEASKPEDFPFSINLYVPPKKAQGAKEDLLDERYFIFFGSFNKVENYFEFHVEEWVPVKTKSFSEVTHKASVELRS
jgi:hypothetical protein